MHKLSMPRYMTAQNRLPGDPLFWEFVLGQSDLFSYVTANEGRGGPFGAQLWLMHPESERYVLVGTAEEHTKGNAVLSKGRASAHAEAECLLPENRLQIIKFLEEQQKGWKIVQVSSAESCPSCRAKQVLFAEELMARQLIEEKSFFVLFKGTYQQSRDVAGFSDIAYDQAFRAIDYLDLLNKKDGLLNIESAFHAEPWIAKEVKEGRLVYNSITLTQEKDVPEAVSSFLKNAGQIPAAIIMSDVETVLGSAVDTRDSGSAINEPENTAIVRALYNAASSLRDNGKFDSWNLGGARLYSNIRNIGPVAYSESLWYNLSEIYVVEQYATDRVDELAEELSGISNRQLFKKVVADYDNDCCSLNVVFTGNPEQPNVAHLLWKAKLARGKLEQEQSNKAFNLKKKAGALYIGLIGGEKLSISELAHFTGDFCDYDGKKASA